jgi:hypothetical protein
LALWPAVNALGDAGSLSNPGPCNVITVFTDTDELQDDIFDHFVIKPHATIQWVRADHINTWFSNQLKTGNITCTSTNSTSTSTVTNQQRTISIAHSGEEPEEPEEPAYPIAGLTGPTGPTGPTGATGPTGPTGQASAPHEPTPHEPQWMLGRLGPVRSADGRPVKGARMGRLYRIRLAAYRRVNGRWVRSGPALSAAFRVECRIASSRGCL